MYDVIVIGARVAGSPTAMLLARKGYKVLLLDRASFPSDTLSTHQVQLKGGAALQRWGLLDKVLASNCPPARQASFNTGPSICTGIFPPLEGVDAVISPRRTILDKILVDAAVEAGAELREDLLVEALTFEGGQVNRHPRPDKIQHGGAECRGLRAGPSGDRRGRKALAGRPRSGSPGLQHQTSPHVRLLHVLGRLAPGGRRDVLFAPKSSGRLADQRRHSMIYTAYPAAEFQHVRGDIEAYFWKTIDTLPGLAERVHAGKQAERFYGTADLPAFYRKPYGSGWALVGDAGMTMDPITGQGIGNAIRDAERLTEALDAGYAGRVPLETALADYESQRNEDTHPMYEFTSQLAAFTPPSVQEQVLFAALARKPGAADRFFGALTGSVPLQEFFAPPQPVPDHGL